MYFCLLLLTGIGKVCEPNVNDTTIARAVDLWVINKTAAREKFCDISIWNVSSVTDMHGLFGGIRNFNDDITKWDTAFVTDMSGMFRDSSKFNQDIRNWNTTNVNTFESMFDGAMNFNRDISKWNTGKVKSMRQMFQRAYSFNRDISLWNVSNVQEHGFLQMFQGSGHLYASNCDIVNNIATNFSKKNTFWTSLDARLHGCLYS
tara:strand:+ start:9953 stop:10564 length:612 start_codon:yes stop_codon:yes gene_type:complete